jgi:hypothetical protein
MGQGRFIVACEGIGSYLELANIVQRAVDAMGASSAGGWEGCLASISMEWNGDASQLFELLRNSLPRDARFMVVSRDQVFAAGVQP